VADYTVKRFDEMEPLAATHRKIHPGPEGVRILALGGIPGGVYTAPPFTELGGPDPVPDPARIA
jgi:hypothetical protein